MKLGDRYRIKIPGNPEHGKTCWINRINPAGSVSVRMADGSLLNVMQYELEPYPRTFQSSIGPLPRE